MNNRNNKQKKGFIYLMLTITTLILVGGFIFVLVASGMHTNKTRDNSNIIKIDKNVEIVNTLTGEKQVANLPKRLPLGEYEVSITLREHKDYEPYIYIKGKYLSFTALCDGDVFYDYQPQDTNVAPSGGLFVRIFKIPANYLNKKITLHFKPAITSSYGIKIPSIYIGTKSNLLLHNPEKSIGIFLYVVFMIVFSMVSFIVILILIINKKLNIQTMLVPIFSFISAVYIVAPTPPMYMLISRGPFQYAIEYTFFMLQPICIALFVLNIFQFDDKNHWGYKSVKVLSYLMILNLIMQVLLTFRRQYEFMEMQKITYTLVLVLAIILVIVSFSKSAKTKKNIPTTVMIFIISLMFIVILIDFLMVSHIRISYLITIPSTVFLTLQLWIAMNNYSKNYHEISETKFYEELAFRDPLTRLSNRNAIERDFSTINKDTKGKLLLMIIDVNNLKFINDHYGHQAGDNIIEITGRILRNTKERFVGIHPYRIGGDEFAIICINPKKNYEYVIREYIEEEIATFKTLDPDLKLSLAIGATAVDISPSLNPKDLAMEADKNMYRDKKRKKEESSS